MAKLVPRVLCSGVLVGLVLSPIHGLPSEPLTVMLSMDVSSTVGGVSVSDRDAAELRESTSDWRVAQNLDGVLPAGVDVDAISRLPNGDIVVSVDSSFSHGGVSAADEDLLLFSSGALSLLLDGDANGIPGSADIDALHVSSLNPIAFYYSLSAPAYLGRRVVSDDDIMLFTGGTHSVAWPGADLLGSEAKRADVDALCVLLGDSGLVFSTDVSVANMQGLTAADDEDVIFHAGGVNSLRIDVSAAGLGRAVDVDALHVVEVLFADGFETGDTGQWSSAVGESLPAAKHENGGS